MNLYENNELFLNIIQEASDINIDAKIIEKDYYVTLFLKDLIALDNDFIFKGGTCLSKAYKIIDRFSEDIDLSYSFSLLTTGRRKRIKKEIISVIDKHQLTLLNLDETKSRRAFNRYRIDYPSFFESIDSIKPTLIVETAFQSDAYPSNIKSVNSMIYDFLYKKGLNDIIEKYNLQPFNVKVLSLERTLVDKTFALCDYYMTKRKEAHSRHIYDINMLLKHVELNDKLLELFLKVREDRKSLSICPSSKDDVIVSDVLNDIITSKYYEDDYNNKTLQICFKPIPYDEVIPSLDKVRVYLKNHMQ